MGHGHGLQVDPAGAGDDGVHQALAAEKDVLHALDHLDVHLAGGVHHGHDAGVADELLAGDEVVLGAVAVELKEGEAGACDLLHDEALAADEAGAQLLLQVDGEFHAEGGAEEGRLLTDDALAGAKLPGDDAAGEGGGEGDLGGALGRVVAQEQALTGEHPAEGLAGAAAFRLGQDGASGPGASADLADDGLAGVELDHDGRQAAAHDGILHGVSFLSSG